MWNIIDFRVYKKYILNKIFIILKWFDCVIVWYRIDIWNWVRRIMYKLNKMD